MKIVGFTGKKYSGKDFAAQALMDDHEYWHRTAFADPLREMLYTLNPVCVVSNPGGESLRWRELWDTRGYDAMKTLPEVRRLMQVFGTEVMRERFGKNVWVNLTLERIKKFEGANRWWVVSDVRFDNEATAIRSNGGVIIEIVRTGDGVIRDSHGAEHVSEEGISRDLIDATISNNGTEMFAPDVVNKVRELFR